MKRAEKRLLRNGLDRLAEQTSRRLAAAKAQAFVTLYNDWIDLSAAIIEAYPKKMLEISLVMADLSSLGKELVWMHRLLHWGNYPTVFRNLRYAWELISLAVIADAPNSIVATSGAHSGKSIDVKLAWLDRRAFKLNWRTAIRPLLQGVVERSEHGYFGCLWGRLNKCVHASAKIRSRLMGESAAAVKDAFDQTWAEETCQISTDVFDIIWLLILRRFPGCVKKLAGSQCFSNTPRSRRMIAP
jgi:hypothetical protein